MTKRKFTDEQIIKALELHSKDGEPCLDKCPYADKRYCGSKMAKDALDLINRQRAEIERLTVEYAGFRGAANSLKMHYNNARAEAIQEFRERLLSRGRKTLTDTESMQFGIIVTDVLKELTEGKQ